jgi:hypothetical protein
VDGYNPSAGQYESKSDPLTGSATGATAGAPTKPPAAAAVVIPTTNKPPPRSSSTSSTTTSIATLSRAEKEQKIDVSIQTLLKYRTANDGGNAIKLLLTFVKNIHDNPLEMKYRSINTEGNAFKTKLSPLVGPMMILKALGFVPEEGEGKLKLEG